MKTSELKKKIAESTNPDWFNSTQVTFDFPYISFSKSFIGISSIFVFVNQQINGWNKLNATLPREFVVSRGYFENINNQIIQLISTPIIDQRLFNNKWNEIKNLIITVNNKPFLYDIPETDFLINVFKVNPQIYQGAYYFIVNQFNSLFNDKSLTIGALLAYEFTLKDKSDLATRRNSEKASLDKIKNDFHSYISESETQLSEHLKNANENYKTYVEKIDSFKSEKENMYNDWFEKSKKDLDQFNTVSNNTIKDLEKTYEELLRLKKPAEYWNLRAKELKKQGWKSLYWIIGLVLFACATLYSLLWLTPEGMLKTFFSDDKSSAIRWSIIFITFISFLFFGIRALTKVTFSSFHLARDAEERERLTFVYLALIKETNIGAEERQLVMQSLFSRSDTGLLKDDSSPSMPGAGAIVENIIRK